MSALALGLLLGALAGSASAAITAQQVAGEGQFSTPNSSNKSVTVDTCPDGWKVLGAAAEVPTAAANSQVHLSVLRPSADLESVLATAQEDENGFADSWGLIGRAVCTHPILELERVTTTTTATSSNKMATASCPTGKKAVGGGGEVVNGSQQVVMNTIKPTSGLTGFAVRGAEDGTGFSGSWKLTAYAICAKPPAGLQLVSNGGSANSNDKSVTRACPPDKVLTGVGGEIAGAGGQAALDLAFLSDNSFEARGFEDENGFGGNWSITAFAICANVSVISNPDAFSNSTNVKSTQADCPSGLQATGGGAEITSGLGQVVLDQVQPVGAPPTGFLTEALEDDTLFGGSWSLDAYAICATPLPGLEVRSNVTTTGSFPARTVASDCTSGKRLVGAGGDIVGGLGQVVLNRIVPTGSPPTGVEVHASEDEDGYADNWFLESYAICANPPPGHELVTVESSPLSDPHSALAKCPPGKNVLGAAGSVSGSGQVVMDDLRPRAFDVTVTGLEDETGHDSPWTVTAHAICANP